MSVSCFVWPETLTAFDSPSPVPCARKNIDDALSKMQVMIERAVESVREREIDPETQKKLEAR